MAEQRQPFRFRLPWLTAVTAPRPAADTQAPAQPTTPPRIQRPPFRPGGIASPQPAPQTPPKVERQPSPPRATQTRAASVPPSPTRGTAESRVSSQPASPSRATTQIVSPPRAATQPRAASVPPSPSRTASQTQPTVQTGPQPQYSLPFASRTTGQTSSQPSSPLPKATHVPPSPSRGTTESRVSSQPASPSHATSQIISPPRAATQPRAAPVPPFPSRTASQTQSAIQAGPQPLYPLRFASRTTGQTSSQPSSPVPKATQVQPTAGVVSQPLSPPKKPQPLTQVTSRPPLNLIQPPSSIPSVQEPKPARFPQPSQEYQPKTQIKSEIVSESQYQTASETTFKRDKVVAQPTQASDLVTALTPTSMEESEKKFEKTEGKKAVEEQVKEGKSEDGKIVAVERVKGDTDEAVDEEQMRRTLTKLLSGAPGELPSATFQTGEREQEKQGIFESKKPLSTSKSDEKQIETVSSTHLKDRDTPGNIHQKPDISHGEKAPLHKEIKSDILKFARKLTLGHPKQPMDEKPVSIITLAGENRGVSMHIGSESTKKDGSVHIHRGYKIASNEIPESTTTDGEGSSKETIPRDSITKKDQATKVFINSNTQSINNSILLESSVEERNPGVKLDFSHNSAEPTKSTIQPGSIEARKAEFSITPAENLTYQPIIRRRCLRGLFMEPSDSDPDNPEKPRRHGCLYNCGEKNKDKEMGVV